MSGRDASPAGVSARDPLVARGMFGRPHAHAGREAWIRWGRTLAWITVAYNLIEGIVSMGFGAADESVALFGFGADSFIEVGSALLVLWRLSAERDATAEVATGRERRATRGIGALFVALALGTAVGSALQLGARSHPETTVPGVVVALVSLSFMVALWLEKRRTARALDSPALAGDAACSLACIKLSSVLLTGSVLFLLANALWWADAAAALVLSVLIGREGLEMFRAAGRPDFAGACGCHD